MSRLLQKFTLFWEVLKILFQRNIFRDELMAVALGNIEYRNARQEYPNFRLRRNVHMLEKGLTFKNRRDTFATDYITETISEFIDFIKEGNPSEDDYLWMRSVLDKYFLATQTSEHTVIQTAREAYLSYFKTIDSISADLAPPHVLNDPDAFEKLMKVIENRRSVRWYEQVPIPSEIIQNALRAASFSPTACNRQPFKYHILTTHPLINDVASLARGTAGFSEQLTNLAVVVGDLSAFKDEVERHLIYIDASLSAMQFVLALESQGVSSCVINWPAFPDIERRAAQLLGGLDMHHRVIMLIAFGIADTSSQVASSIKRTSENISRFHQDVPAPAIQ